MKILVACEYSGRVRDALIKQGHDAISCDFNDTETPGPHYKGDLMDVIHKPWDGTPLAPTSPAQACTGTPEEHSSTADPEQN